MLNRLTQYKLTLCLILIVLMAFSVTSCGKAQETPVIGEPNVNEGTPSPEEIPAEVEKLNPDDANSVLAAVLSSPYITCLGKTRLEMDAAFGPIVGSEWLDGMLYYHKNYPGMVSYTNADVDYQVKDTDTCTVVNILLMDVVPEIVGKSLTVDAGIWGDKALSSSTEGYEYTLPIENGFLVMTCDKDGNIDVNSVIFAKLGK